MAEDETSPAPATTQAAAKPVAKKRSKKKAHKQTKIVEPKAPKTTAKPAQSGAALIAVYVILALLAVAGSFYTGYLFGKTSGGPSTGDNTGGNGGAQLQIIAYSDYQCPFCGRVEPTLKQVEQTYGNKIQMVFKNFPLESIHPFALNAAIAAECARDQGEDQFWKYHDTLFAHQDALDIPQLKQYAQAQGLDTTKFNDCLDNKKTEARVRADIAEATAKGVQGTPSFWIKDELFVGAQPFASFQAKIDEKLSGKAAAPVAPSQPSAPAAPTAPVNVATGTHIKGDVNAKVTIVEFSDFQCPFCKRFFDETEGQLNDQYVKTGKVKIYFRNYPLPFHQNAQKAAEAAECAGQQGKFWEMHDVMFTKGAGDGTGLAVADLKQYAADLKLDTTKFNTCLDTSATAAAVKKDSDDGQAAGVSGTPSFIVNGQLVVGAQPFSAFKTAIDAALAK